jgi:hypothetical protein
MASIPGSWASKPASVISGPTASPDVAAVKRPGRKLHKRSKDNSGNKCAEVDVDFEVVAVMAPVPEATACTPEPACDDVDGADESDQSSEHSQESSHTRQVTYEVIYNRKGQAIGIRRHRGRS